jgi:hypothetical protein
MNVHVFVFNFVLLILFYEHVKQKNQERSFFTLMSLHIFFLMFLKYFELNISDSNSNFNQLFHFHLGYPSPFTSATTCLYNLQTSSGLIKSFDNI